MNRDTIFYALLTAVILFRFFPYGLTYFPYLDDYIAYGVTHYLLLDGEGLFSLYFHYGMHTARPLAGLLDVLVIAPLWQHMWLVLLGMALLHANTLPLMNAVFKQLGLPYGKVAAVVFGLYPLLGESLYWINAAARIVPGFFLLMLSAFFLCKYFNDERKRNLIIAFITGLLSLGFYEQTVSFGFALFLLIIYHYRKHKAWYAWPVLYAGIFTLYYAVFLRAGRMASRASHAGVSLDTFRDIGRLLVKEQAYNVYSLLKIEVFRIPYLITGVCVIAAVLLALTLKEREKPIYNGMFSLTFALLLFLAAFGPFFILRDSFLSLRSLFFCVPVIAMLTQWAWDKLCKYKPLTPLIGFVIAVFLLLSVGSVNAFRVNYQDDSRIAEQIVNILYHNGHPSDYRKVWLTGARYQFSPHGGVHLHSATLSDWSLSVLVNAHEMERFGTRHISPYGGYFMHPIMDGQPINDLDRSKDCWLNVDRSTLVQKH